MGHGGSASESQLKRALEEESTEDHKVVTVSVLRLHDLDALNLGAFHPYSCGRFASRCVGVVVVDLLEP